MKITKLKIFEFIGLWIAGAIVIILSILVVVPCFLAWPIRKLIDWDHRRNSPKP